MPSIKRRIGGQFNGWSVFIVLVALLMLLPLFFIFIRLFQPAGEAFSHIVKTLLGTYLLNTLLLIVMTGGLALSIGTLTGWLVSQYRFPGRQLFAWALILPLSLPTYLTAIALAGIFNVAGPVPLDIMTLPGLAVVLALCLYPYVYLMARTAFSTTSGRLIEAATALGKPMRKVFFTIALPMAGPALFGGLSLVFMELLNDYGAAKYFGIQTFTTGIFKAWFALDDLDSALRLSAILLVVVGLILLVERQYRFSKRHQYQQKNTRPYRRRKLGVVPGMAALLVCLLPLVLGFALPVVQLIAWALETQGVGTTPDMLQLVGNSVLVAGLAGVAIILLTLLMNFGLRWNGTNWPYLVHRTANIGYAIPGAVLAVGVLVVSVGLDQLLGAGMWLTGSLTALIFAYVLRFMAVGNNAVDAGFDRLPDNLTQASRSLGRGSWFTLLNIHSPLLRTGMLAAAILVFVDVMKELSLTLILRPFNFDTLATKTFELASDERLNEAALPALLIVLTGIVPILVMNRLISREQA